CARDPYWGVPAEYFEFW
nr:immunoglobulin heavy chain junction region [Macaca mulatta]